MDLTVHCALDALSHALEAIWNHNANPVSDALATRVLATLPAALRDVLRRSDDLSARAALQEASVLAGLASSGTRTAIAHSMSYPLTLSLGMPHGLACSFALPEILRLNGEAYPERGRLIGEALGARSLTSAVRLLYRLLEDARVPEALRRYVPEVRKLNQLERELLHPGRAANNLVRVSCEGARELLARSYSHLLGVPSTRVAVPKQAPDNGGWNHRGAST